MKGEFFFFGFCFFKYDLFYQLMIESIIHSFICLFICLI